MKHLLMSVAAIAVWAGSQVHASTIVTQTTSLHDLRDSAQNLIFQSGDKLFNFQNQFFSSVATGGADAPTDSEIFISGITIGAEVGIVVQSAKWNTDAGATIDTAFGYKVSIQQPSILVITDATLTLASYGTEGDGSIHVTETLKHGSKTVASMVAQNEAPGPGPDTDHHVWGNAPGYTWLTASKDISLEGHTGSASISYLYQTYSQDARLQSIPEPGSLVLSALGGCGLFGMTWARRRRGARVSTRA